MNDIAVSIYRCPNCGLEVATADQLEDGDLECGMCAAALEFAGHRDIAVDEM